MTMRRSLVLALVLVMSLSFAGPSVADTMEDIRDTTSKIGDVLKDVGDIFDAGRTIYDEVNKIGSVADPKMNPNYVMLKRREIQRALENYQEAKRRYNDTGWYRPFARKSRKKEMKRALEENLDKVESFSQAQVNFKYDVYRNSDGVMIWRKPARKESWQNSLRSHSEFLLNRSDSEVKRTKKEYDDAWWIFFWNKAAKKKAYEQAKDNYDMTREEVERMWMEAGLMSDSGWFSSTTTLPAESEGGAERIGRDGRGDM